MASSIAEPAANPDTTAKPARPWLILAAIMAVGFGLRLYHIGNHGLFVDEIYSVLLSSGKCDPELAQFDASRPLYFLLLKAWMLISTNESWMRFLSVIFGTANIALTYEMGKQFCNSKAGLAAALMMALSPMEVHYSQQVRMYTLGTFWVLAGTIALSKAFEKQSKQLVFAWAIARLLMILTLPLTGIMFLIDAFYAFKHRQGSKLLRPMALAFLLIIVLWSPFVWIVIQAHASEYDAWRASLDCPDLYDFFTLLINFTSTAVPLQESGGPLAFDWFTRVYLVVFPMVLISAVASSFKQAKMLWCCAYGLAPLTLMFIWSNIDAPLLITRYTMFTAPFVVILLAFGWADIWNRFRAIGFGVAGVYLLAMTSSLTFFYSHAVHEDWHPAADYLATHAKPGDDIVVWNYHSRYLIGYYYHGQNRITDLRVITYPEPQDDPEHPLVRLQFMGIDPKPGQRIWIVSRDAAEGWTRAYEVYGLYKEAISRRFNVLHHEHQVMTDIWEVTGR